MCGERRDAPISGMNHVQAGKSGKRRKEQGPGVGTWELNEYQKGMRKKKQQQNITEA